MTGLQTGTRRFFPSRGVQSPNLEIINAELNLIPSVYNSSLQNDQKLNDVLKLFSETLVSTKKSNANIFSIINFQQATVYYCKYDFLKILHPKTA